MTVVTEATATTLAHTDPSFSRAIFPSLPSPKRFPAIRQCLARLSPRHARKVHGLDLRFRHALGDGSLTYGFVPRGRTRELPKPETILRLRSRGSANLPVVPPAGVTAISMSPPIMMAVASPVESRAINITVHDPPHDWTAIPVDHRTIDIPVGDTASDYRAAVMVAIPTTIAVSITPSGISRCSSQATKHNGGQHGEELQLTGHEQFPRRGDCSLGTELGVNSL
jgi:hypothetical protein